MPSQAIHCCIKFRVLTTQSDTLFRIRAQALCSREISMLEIFYPNDGKQTETRGILRNLSFA